MAIVRTVLYDDAFRTDWMDVDTTIGYMGLGTDWKPGSDRYNDEQLRLRLAAALPTFESNYTNWATLTNAQKDTANRQAQRACAALIRRLLGELDSPGV